MVNNKDDNYVFVMDNLQTICHHYNVKNSQYAVVLFGHFQQRYIRCLSLICTY